MAPGLVTKSTRKVLLDELRRRREPYAFIRTPQLLHLEPYALSPAP